MLASLLRRSAHSTQMHRSLRYHCPDLRHERRAKGRRVRQVSAARSRSLRARLGRVAGSVLVDGHGSAAEVRLPLSEAVA
jgi:hypothetical protein